MGSIPIIITGYRTQVTEKKLYWYIAKRKFILIILYVFALNVIYNRDDYLFRFL